MRLCKCGCGIEIGNKRNLYYNGHITGSMLGKKLSEETKNKLSKLNIGKWLGRKHTKESIDKIKQFYILHPNSHANYIMSQKGFISKPQKELYNKVLEKFNDAILEYPIKTWKCMRYIDVTVPSKKLAFEFDGKYFHHGKEEKDNIRQKEIENEGWKVFRFNEDNLYNMKSIINLV